MTPWQRYQQELHKSGMVEDARQKQAVALTQSLYEQLHKKVATPGWLSRLFRRNRACLPGLYFHGGTGRGKTWLMDGFYACLPFAEKHRVHFHRFMLEIHERLEQLPRSPDPLTVIGKELAKRYRLLCLDEFHVHDIADAMIMARLLEAMFENGLTLMATSNIAIEDLYKNGLQRERFMPAIVLLHKHLREFDLGTGTDYRLDRLRDQQTWQIIDRAEAEQTLGALFEALSDLPPKHRRSLLINHRQIPYIALAGSLVWFDFQVLCNTPRAASDFIELASQFQCVMISHITVMGEDQDDVAKRFIHLVDALYDHRVKLLASADAMPDELYRGRRLAFAFERTSSRLFEMSSENYLATQHLSRISRDDGQEDHDEA